MTNSFFSLLFLACLAASLAVRLWLARRHVRHVLANRSAVPPAFADTISLDAHTRAADYTARRVRLGMVNACVSAGLLLAFTLGGGIQSLAVAWAHVARPAGMVHGVALIASVAVIGWLVELPFTLYRVFVIEERFGFNRVTPRLFFVDTLKEALLAAILGLPILAAALWIVAASGTWWWLYVWSLWLALNVLFMVLWPTLIAPLFNKFAPLDDSAMKARIEALLARCGFRASGLFVMDGSRRSAHGNAYFTGLGAAKRIVFFDTLLNKLLPEEIEAVLAHELGHFRHHHVAKRLVATAASTLGLLWLLGWLIQQPWFFGGLGVTNGDVATGLLLFMLVLPVFLFPLSPLLSHWSRKHEYEADAYAARQTRAEDLVGALVKLYRDNAATLTPDPYYSSFHDSHPPAALRVARLRAIA